MPINRNALIRYKTIDRMLRGGRQTTLEELIDSCSDALLDYCGKGDVSRRTIQNDLQEMRYSEALGYHAPIEVVDKKYYTYKDRHYSITKMPLSVDDMMQLSEAVDLLKQMSAFSGFDGVEDVVNRLEDHVASMRYKAEPAILLDNNENLRGLKYITPLHDAITNRTPVTITYKSFKATEPITFVFSPYILKEYNNRWFVFGKWHHGLPELAEQVDNLALDRIEGIEAPPSPHVGGISNTTTKEEYIRINSFNPRTYFRDMIGVSRNMDSKVEHVEFNVSPQEVPYIRTKPLHHSQKEVSHNDDGSAVFSIDVILNKELEQRILSYGDMITVLSPQILVDRIKRAVNTACSNYRKIELGTND